LEGDPATPRTLEVGFVVKPHGLRGEVVVHLVTNRLERLDPGTVLACARPALGGKGGAPSPPSAGPPSAGSRGAGPPSAGPRGAAGDRTSSDAHFPAVLEVVESRSHQGRHLVRFAGVTTLEQAEKLRGACLSAEPLDDPDAFFVHELIGCTLVDRAGIELGVVTAVEANPASDLLVVDDRHYVPLRFVVERAPGSLVIDAPDGLFD